MKNLSQKDFNEVADYYYGLLRDETSYQSNRMMWIIAAQALVFTGVSALLDSSKYLFIAELENILLCLLVIVGIFISFSAVYTYLISDISVGSILDDWNYYDNLPIKKKPKPIHHKIIVAPDVILNSKLSWLAFHAFAPKVFATAWIVLILFVILGNHISPQPTHIFIYFMVTLVILHAFVHFYRIFIQLRINQKFYKKIDSDDDSSQYLCNGIHCINKFCCSYYNHCCCYGSCCNYFKPKGLNCTNSSNSSNKNCFSHCNGIIDNNLYPSLSPGNLDKLSIYHIMIDRFNGGWRTAPKSNDDFVGGNIKGIIEKLGYIKCQGYNAIMLTPIHKSVAYHGYHITDYEKVDEHFGDWEIFKIFVIRAHQLGLKVICDFVPNHCHKQHPFFQNALKHGDKRNWFYFNRDNSYACFMGYDEMPKFNLKNYETASYLINIAKMLALCGIDGIRVDHAIGVPFEFLKSLRIAVKDINPNIIVFGEVLPVDSNHIDWVEFKTKERLKQVLKGTINQDDLQLDYVDILDGVLDFVYRDIIIAELKKSRDISVTNLGLMSKLCDHFNKYPKGFIPIIFLDNHDVDRIMFHCNGNKCLMDKILDFTRSLHVPYCIYYGTEQYMCNNHPLDSGIDNVDLEVRKPMDWS